MAPTPLRVRFVGAVASAEGYVRHNPGDMFYLTHEPGHCWIGWTNCDGRHLIVVCPDGRHWDVDSRASNCTLHDDHTHRCWVRTGDPEARPPRVSAGRGGVTCAAGAGSIQTEHWHGFLDDGWLCEQRGQRGPEPSPEEASPMSAPAGPAGPATPPPAPAAPALPPPPHPEPRTMDEHSANFEHALRHRVPADGRPHAMANALADEWHKLWSALRGHREEAPAPAAPERDSAPPAGS